MRGWLNRVYANRLFGREEAEEMLCWLAQLDSSQARCDQGVAVESVQTWRCCKL